MASAAVYVSGAAVPMHVLTWNLFHGRAVPPAGRELLEEFAAALAGWEWDVARCRRCRRGGRPSSARRLGAEHRAVLTSRNALVPLRRALAVRWPDAIKSNGGGANAILVRGGGTVSEHRRLRLARWPERRWMHGVRLSSGVWVGNLHASTSDYAARARGHARGLDDVGVVRRRPRGSGR